MATTITSGNATNGGAAISSDNTGILELKTGSGSGTTALTLSTAQAATFAGAITSSGLVTGATGALYPIVSGTAITLTNQTAPEFTGIPSWAKRITLMFQGISTNSTGTPLIQLGTGSTTYTTSGYLGSASSMDNVVGTTNYTTGFGTRVGAAATVFHGNLIITNVNGNAWVASGNTGYSNTSASAIIAGSVSLGDTLTAVRLFIDGTQFFDAGTINIMWE
jgi:hypothetical protein